MRSDHTGHASHGKQTEPGGQSFLPDSERSATSEVTEQVENQQHDKDETQAAATAHRPAVGIPATAQEQNQNNNDQNSKHELILVAGRLSTT